MVKVQKFILVPVLTSVALVDPAFAFTASTNNAILTRPCFISASLSSPQNDPSHLFLHPDQAAELEAAATELLKGPSEDSEEFEIPGHHENKEMYDDTKQQNSGKSPLSAASASSFAVKQPDQWWSKTFTSLVRRH
mmetsp:Transcript_491/g.685  ORF Transcript_491/g.685 Transcript_491/m.685 type:complete len:136 (+) Transcript_491:287-694(+)